MPRFKLRRRTDLKRVLPGLGVRASFDPDRADLTRIFEPADRGQRLYVDLALQEAIVEVTEEGTRASAATTVGASLSSLPARPPPRPYLFRADRPFIFVIYNRRLGGVLFIGKVGDPRAA
jgi:serpin B